MLFPLQVQKEKQVSQGDLEIRHGSDILIEVLGPEHPGRMRAVGYNVNLKQSILETKEKNRKKCDMLDLKEMKEKQEEQAKTIANMAEKITMLQREVGMNNDQTVTTPVVNESSIEVAPMVDALDKITVSAFFGITYIITYINTLNTYYLLYVIRFRPSVSCCYLMARCNGDVPRDVSTHLEMG